MSDAVALALLDRLLDLDAERREQELALIATQDASLYQRLVRMCRVATEENSQLLAQPVAAGLQLATRRAVFARQPDEIFAGYRLVRELGRGGMAVVWLAERIDGVIKRPVALKLPLRAMSDVESQRFAREKDVLAALNHPHIARMYDAGIAPSGQPYIVLEYIDGVPLTLHCDQNGLSLNQRLQLFLDVLAAVDHAHKHLVIHRDLKPSNILVDDQGAVKLLDFGIARLMSDPANEGAIAELTQHGGIALTPLYAAPEQVRAQAISTSTDVYVLGAVLYELLSGTVPHAAGVGVRPSLAQWVEAISRPGEMHVRNAPLNDDLARKRGLPNARRMRAALAGDLDVIVHKAMRHAPAARYSSVDRFADDLRQYLARRPIAARATSVWYSAGLFVRRHLAASVAAALGAIAFLSAGAVALQKQTESRMYAARSAAVRDFMYDFVNDVEPSELQADVPVPFIEMLGAAVVRARRDFNDRPDLQGELLSELGRMYSNLGESDKGTPILAEALALLQKNARSDDPALNKARAFYASDLLDENEVEQARALVVRARDDCTRDTVDCAKARAYALTLLARIEMVDGKGSQALATRRQAVAETKQAFGRDHAMTVLSLQGLATVARNTGHLREAATVMNEAIGIGSHVTMRRSDRLSLERMMAVVDLDMGRYAAARARLSKLLPGVTDRGERSLQLRLLANTLLGAGDPHAALTAANTALDLAEPGARQVEPLFARQAHARALSLTNEADRAVADMDAVIEGLRELQYGENSLEMIRARRIHAEILLRDGRVEAAAVELRALLTQLQGSADAPQLEWGQVLDLHGCALRESGKSTEAAAAHEQARRRLEEFLPPDHPFMVRNTLYKEAATNHRAELERDAATARGMFDTNSLWRLIIDARLDPAKCPSTGLHQCVFIL